MKRLFVLCALLAVAACGAQSPPPVATAPPPAPAANNFVVFFSWDSSSVTADGWAILRQAAAAYGAGAPVTVQVTGYTDRTGSFGYNERLSVRRANNIAGILTQMGVPRSALMVSGHGENDNRVPTANGVPEQQNRRVEIVEGGPPQVSMR